MIKKHSPSLPLPRPPRKLRGAARSDFARLVHFQVSPDTLYIVFSIAQVDLFFLFFSFLHIYLLSGSSKNTREVETLVWFPLRPQCLLGQAVEPFVWRRLVSD